MIRTLTIISMLLVATISSRADAARLTVTVQGVPDARGHIRIGVCPKASFLSDICPYHAIVSANQGDVIVTIDGISPGIYAVGAFQDLDGSGRLRRNLFGIPQEPAGFSRNPPTRFGPPRFDDTAVRVGREDGAITLRLRVP